MRKSIGPLLILILSSCICAQAQQAEIEGQLKVTEMPNDNTADSLVIVLPDGTLGVRDMASIQAMIDQAILNFGLAQGQKGVDALLDAGYTLEDIIGTGIKVQTLLMYGVSPLDILDAGVSTDSIYGKTYQGGLIFYLDDQDTLPGIEGMVAAPTDQSTDLEWGCFETLMSGADGTIIGSGYQNTLDIIADCGEANIAAKICNDLVLNGFDDWFLPSIDELGQMYLNLHLSGLGDFTNLLYWSSSEISDQIAWARYFLTGNQETNAKFFDEKVRAVRAF